MASKYKIELDEVQSGNVSDESLEFIEDGDDSAKTCLEVVNRIIEYAKWCHSPFGSDNPSTQLGLFSLKEELEIDVLRNRENTTSVRCSPLHYCQLHNSRSHTYTDSNTIAMLNRLNQCRPASLIQHCSPMVAPPPTTNAPFEHHHAQLPDGSPSQLQCVTSTYDFRKILAVDFKLIDTVQELCNQQEIHSCMCCCRIFDHDCAMGEAIPFGTVGWAGLPRAVKCPCVVINAEIAPQHIQKSVASSKIADKQVVLYFPTAENSYAVVSASTFVAWGSEQQSGLEAALAKKHGEAKAKELVRLANGYTPGDTLDNSTKASTPVSGGKRIRLVRSVGKSAEKVPEGAPSKAEPQDTHAAESPAPAPAPATPYVDPLEKALKAAFAFTAAKRDEDARSVGSEGSKQHSSKKKSASKAKVVTKPSKKAASSPVRKAKSKPKPAPKRDVESEEEEDVSGYESFEIFQREEDEDSPPPTKSKRPRVDVTLRSAFTSEKPVEAAKVDVFSSRDPETLLQLLNKAVKDSDGTKLWQAIQGLQEIKVSIDLLKRVKLIEGVKGCTNFPDTLSFSDSAGTAHPTAQAIREAAKDLLTRWRAECSAAIAPSKPKVTVSTVEVSSSDVKEVTDTTATQKAKAASNTTTNRLDTATHRSRGGSGDAVVAEMCKGSSGLPPHRACAVLLLTHQLREPMQVPVAAATSGMPTHAASTLKAAAKDVLTAVARALESRVAQDASNEDLDRYAVTFRAALVWLNELDSFRKTPISTTKSAVVKVPPGFLAYKALLAAMTSCLSSCKQHITTSGKVMEEKQELFASLAAPFRELILHSKLPSE